MEWNVSDVHVISHTSWYAQRKDLNFPMTPSIAGEQADMSAFYL